MVVQYPSIQLSPHTSCRLVLGVDDKQNLESLNDHSRGCKAKRVRLLNQTTIIPPDRKGYYADENKCERWYSPNDLKLMKHSGKAEVSRLRLNPSACNLSLAHRKTTLLLNSNVATLLRLPSRTLPGEDLIKWCQVEDGRRGLERFASNAYAGFRKSDMLNTLDAVLSEQMRQRIQNDHNPERIAQLSRATSLRCRKFSACMGQADHFVASTEYIHFGAEMKHSCIRTSDIVSQ